MSIAVTLSKLLNKNNVPYKIYSHPRMANIFQSANWHKLSLSQVIDSQVLVAKGYYVLVVYPATREIDLEYLNQKLNKNFSVLEPRLANRIFKDCEVGLTIPFGHPYKLDVIIDKNIENIEDVYFNSGSQTSLIEMSLSDFLFLNLGSLRLYCSKKVEVITDSSVSSFKTKISIEGYDLPVIPNIIRKILELSQLPETTINDLIQLVTQENDTLLNEALGNFAMPLGGADLESGTLVQKFRNLSQVVIGVSTGKALSFKVLDNIDLAAFWSHAFMAAALAEDLTKQVTTLQLDPKISYLSGIFHNIGFILLCKLFPPEF